MHNTDMIRRAMAYAMKCHDGQFRFGSNLPYITHPISVFSIVKQHKDSKNIEEILCASLLHDTIEDCGISKEEIEKSFNILTASLVAELTNNEERIKEIGKEAYMNEHLLELSDWALVIKLADILDNTSDNPSKKMLSRIYNNMSYLKANRKLTNTQQRIYARIMDLIQDYAEPMQMFKFNTGVLDE